MTKPLKAKKTPRNKPVKFDETLAATLPQVPAPTVTVPRLTTGQIRLGLIVIWIAATVCAGIGIGRLIVSGQQSAVFPESPAPVASASVSVSSVPAGPSISLFAVATPPDLKVVTAASINQAQAGQPLAVLAGTTYQPADGSNAFQPGFSHFGHAQGNLGTTPVQ